MFQFRHIACAAAALLTAMPAAAIVKVATYTGTVSAGFDTTGVFGTPGTDLAGLRYVTRYTYDRTLGADQTSDGLTYDRSLGYAYQGNPVISASITINGVTKVLPGDYYGEVYTTTAGFEGHVNWYGFYDGLTLVDSRIQNYDYAPAPASLDQSWGPVAQTGRGQGYASFSTTSFADVIESAYAYLNADGTYSVTDPVPEPSTWALMIAGFGLVGAALRRRERLAAA